MKENLKTLLWSTTAVALAFIAGTFVIRGIDTMIAKMKVAKT